MLFSGVATVADVRLVDGKRNVLVHFDGWSNKFDYVAALDDPDLHPAGYSALLTTKLEAPKDYGKEFRWGTYLNETNAVPVRYFSNLFKSCQSF